MPSVSIVVATYNAEKFLLESIESLLYQTFTDFEILIVNDGSTDNSLNIAKSFLKKDSRVRVLNNDSNYGLAVSRNRGLIAARSKYVAVHDADDISLPDRLEQQVSFLDRNRNVTVVGSHAIKIDLDSKVCGFMSYPPPDTVKAFWVLRNWKLNPIIDPTSMYRKSIIIEAGGYNMDPNFNLMPDLELWCRLLSRNKKIANIQKPLIKYRINPAGMTLTKDKEIREKNEIIWTKLRRMSFEKPELRPGFFLQSCFTELVNEVTNDGKQISPMDA